MPTEPTPLDFDGCWWECRKAGAHTLRWGSCEHAPEPEKTVSISRVYLDHDGQPSIGFDTFTVTDLAARIEAALRTVPIRLGPNALAMLQRGDTVSLSGGEYAAMALAAAVALAEDRSSPETGPGAASGARTAPGGPVPASSPGATTTATTEAQL
jgi:hypothetical protein